MYSFISLIVGIITSYLIGSFPSSFVLTKMLKGIDIRNVGSGNVGATNVLRNVGKLPAAVALLIDLLKGVLVVTFISGFFYRFASNLDYEFLTLLLGLTAICGHIWPVFLRFSGGKGVATTIGVTLIVSPLMILPALAVWLIVFSFTKYVSLASIVMSISLPISAILFGQSFYVVIFAIILCGIISYKHKTNIRRLLKGEENKTILFSRKP